MPDVRRIIAPETVRDGEDDHATTARMRGARAAKGMGGWNFWSCTKLRTPR